MGLYACASKKLRASRGTVGKTVVAGARDQETGQINAAVVSGVTKQELREFADARVAHGAEVFTDDHGGYEGMSQPAALKHSIGAYVSD